MVKVDLGELELPARSLKVGAGPQLRGVEELMAGFGAPRALQHVPADFDPTAGRRPVFVPGAFGSSVDWQATVAAWSVGFAGVGAAMMRYGKAVRLLGERMHRWMKFAYAVDRRHCRCRVCFPRANPAPLCIDGAAYARKRRSRKGRR